jgi:hypothetical protein
MATTFDLKSFVQGGYSQVGDTLEDIEQRAKDILANQESLKYLGTDAPITSAQEALNKIQSLKQNIQEGRVQAGDDWYNKILGMAKSWVTGGEMSGFRKIGERYQKATNDISYRINEYQSNIANLKAGYANLPANQQAELDRQIADWQSKIDTYKPAMTAFGLEVPNAVTQDARGNFVPTADVEHAAAVGAVPGGPAAGTTTAAAPKGTLVEQQPDGTYALVNAADKSIIRPGFKSLQEGLAIQQQMSGGSTPQLTGAPTTYAVAPATEEEKGQVAAGKATVATPDELVNGVQKPTQIRNEAELERLAKLGLTESDLVRQGGTIFMKPGINEQYLSQRAGTPAGSAMVAAGTGAQVPTTSGGFTPDVGATLADQRTATLGTMTGMSMEAQQEGQLLGTIGAGIQQTEKALRELPTTVKERTQNVGVTVGQLNRLVATESTPIAQALKDLLTSRSLLQEQIAFRREETMFQQDQMDKQFNKLLASGMPSATIDPAFFSQMDQMSGLPEGTYNAIYRSNETANQQAAVAATFEAQGKMFDFLSKIPPGQSVEVAGQIYSSTQSPFEYQFHEIDKETGDVVNAYKDKRTGQIIYERQQGLLSPNTEYEKIQGGDDGWWYVDKNNPSRAPIPILPGGFSGGASQGGVGSSVLREAFPQGQGFSDTSWCGEYQRVISAEGSLPPPGQIDTIQQKREFVDQYIGFGAGQRPPQAGDYVMTNEDSTWGHIALITKVSEDPNGNTVAVLSESNYQPGVVTHTRTINLNDKNLETNGGKILGFHKATLKPQFSSQTPAQLGEGKQIGTETAPMTAKEMEAQQTQVESLKSSNASLSDKIKTVNNILENKALDSIVGPTWANRLHLGPQYIGERQTAIADINRLISQETLGTLLNLKAQGGTLGAISEKELAILQEGASNIGSWQIKDENGKVTGYAVSEKRFKQELNRIKDAAVNIVEQQEAKLSNLTSNTTGGIDISVMRNKYNY